MSGVVGSEADGRRVDGGGDESVVWRVKIVSARGVVSMC